MIKIKLKDKLHIQIISEDRQYYEDVKEFFSYYVPGFRFMPRYLNSGWDGKVSLFDFGKKTLPYGLMFDFIKFHKKHYKTLPLQVDDNVKALFIGKKFRPKYNLIYKPYDYQEDCIKAILQHTKCIVQVATASGKSLIISYVIKTLLEKYKNKQYLIIVPTINLVEQFYSDMINYGIDGNIIGRVYADIKEPDKEIVISTWQTLQSNHDWLNRFFAVCVDECHITASGTEIKKILAKTVNAQYRFGVTGTIPAAHLEINNIKSYLGPIIRKYQAKQLGDEGYISLCHILTYLLEYNQEFTGEYFEVKEKVFSNPARLKFIKNTINDIGENNILILVSQIEKEGDVLVDYLKKYMPEKETVFIYGDVKVKEREHHRLDFDNRKNKIVVATYGTYKMGINIPSLKYIMLASPLKSKISVLQSLGRILRKHATKTDGSYVIDLIDKVPYLYGHGETRLKYYEKEGFEINEKIVCLPDTGI